MTRLKFIFWRLKKIKSNSSFLIHSNYLYSYVIPFNSTWKVAKDAPNYIPMNMIGSAHTSREIFKKSDVPMFLVVLITLKALKEPLPPLGSYYTPSALSLIQYLYDPIFSAIMQQWL